MHIRIGYTITSLNEQGGRAAPDISGIASYENVEYFNIANIAQTLVEQKREKMRPGVKWQMNWSAVVVNENGSTQRRGAGVISEGAMDLIVRRAEQALSEVQA